MTDKSRDLKPRIDVSAVMSQHCMKITEFQRENCLESEFYWGFIEEVHKLSTDIY